MKPHYENILLVPCHMLCPSRIQHDVKRKHPAEQSTSGSKIKQARGKRHPQLVEQVL